MPEDAEDFQNREELNTAGIQEENASTPDSEPGSESSIEDEIIETE